MSRFTATMPPEYFEGLYRTESDPWNFAESAYERDKYAATMAALPRQQYRHALECGCSIGVFTRLLKQRAARVNAIDVSVTALDQARERCSDLEGIDFARMVVPQELPSGIFDLLIFSEVLYYLDPGDLDLLTGRVRSLLAEDATIALAHWTGPTNYPLTGDDAAERFIEAMRPTLCVSRHVRHPQYRLDILSTDGDDQAVARSGPERVWGRTET